MDKLQELKQKAHKDLEPVLKTMPPELGIYIDSIIDLAFSLGSREMIRELKNDLISN